MRPPKVLLFDVFGTLVDWKAGIAREARSIIGENSLTEERADAFADAWRSLYQPAMEPIRSGELPYCRLDELHLKNLDAVLKRFGIDIGDDKRVALNKAWHRLDAWHDVDPALTRLRQKFLLAPCSNGNILLMVNLARRNNWHWDAILGADLARNFKPNAVVYQMAVTTLDCHPSEVMMVACHSSDLVAAANSGLQTAFVARPFERGSGGGEVEPEVSVDVIATDLIDLADKLGCK